MLTRLSLTGITLFIFSTSLLASTFQSYDPGTGLVTLDEVPSHSLKLEQRVCIFKKEQLIGCGKVNELYANSAILLMEKNIQPPAKATYVHLKGTLPPAAKVEKQENPQENLHGKHSASTTSEVTSTYGATTVRDFSITGGINAGLNYYYPSLHLQLALSRSWSIGLNPMYGSYKNNGNEVTGYGSYLTLSYYHTHWVFRGLEFEGGVGYYNIKVKSTTDEASTDAIAGKLTVGWRGKGLWDLGLDLGVAGGAQYIHHAKDNLDVSIKDLVPLVTAYIGYSF